jgi:hypothetical protein
LGYHVEVKEGYILFFLSLSPLSAKDQAQVCAHEYVDLKFPILEAVDCALE